MNTTLTSTAATLYAAICREPADDTLRLVFADALDDGAGEVDCPKCNGENIWADVKQRMSHCAVCSGSGRVSNGHAELAEFVRVQVELANWDQANGDFYRMVALTQRDIELLAQHGDGWRRGGVCPRCEGKPWEWDSPRSRGLIACERCHGTGYTSPLAKLRTGFRARNADEWGKDLAGAFNNEVGWSRGLIASYSATHAEVFTDDDPSEWACEVARAFPIQEIRISDFQAWEDEEGWYIGTDSIDGPRLGFGVARLAINLAEKNCVEYPFRTQALAEHYQALAVAQIVRRAAFKEKR